MSDDALTADWPGVKRDGAPELTSGSDRGPSKYRIHTTPLPAGGRGADWLAFFNSQLSRPPVSGYHDGSSLVVECGPDDEPRLTEMVDTAIECANKRLRALYGVTPS